MRSPTGPARAPEASQPHWIWSQQWLDVAFLHWRTSPEDVRRHAPPPLEVDAWKGDAWLSLVLFRLRVRPKWLPYLPCVSNLVEANLRTYVRLRDQPGICFLRVLADNAWAIRAARLLTPMPYIHAAITHRQRVARHEYAIHPQAPDDCSLAVALTAERPPAPTQEGTREAWLLERYRLYLPDRRGRLLLGRVDHPRWSVCPAELTCFSSNLGQDLGLDLSRPPDQAQFATGVAARFSAFERWGAAFPDTGVRYDEDSFQAGRLACSSSRGVR